jgi:hypothetical protein
LVYHLVSQAAGRTPLSFADYPASPVPHSADQKVLFIFLALELAGFFGVFIWVRRYSLKHPEALDALVESKSRFEKHEEGTAWEEVGFHRPLSGLLVGMCLGVVLFIPLIIYQNMILPQFILPSAQALGIWGRVTQFFGLTWVIFDMAAMMEARSLTQEKVKLTTLKAG